MNSHRRAAWTTSTRSTGIRRTIVGRGSRRRRVPAVLLGIALLGAEPGAHRLGELLQAARIGIDPARGEIELDLTPGVAVAGRLVADLDRDRDGQVSDAEGREFAVAVRPAIALELDGRPIQPDVVGVDVAPADALLRGEGRLQLRLGPACRRSPQGHIRSAIATSIARTPVSAWPTRSCRRAPRWPSPGSVGTPASRS